MAVWHVMVAVLSLVKIHQKLTVLRPMQGRYVAKNIVAAGLADKC